MDMSKIVLFRPGTQPPASLPNLRMVKRAFTEFKIRMRREIIKLELEPDQDFEDMVDLQRDRWIMFLGACALMQEIERQSGMNKGEFIAGQDFELYTRFSALKVMGAEEAVA
jgi:hypothetical protein